MYSNSDQWILIVCYLYVYYHFFFTNSLLEFMSTMKYMFESISKMINLTSYGMFPWIEPFTVLIIHFHWQRMLLVEELFKLFFSVYTLYIERRIDVLNSKNKINIFLKYT